MYLSSRFERNLLEYNSDVIYSIHISVIASFAITCMSSYLGKFFTLHILRAQKNFHG